MCCVHMKKILCGLFDQWYQVMRFEQGVHMLKTSQQQMGLKKLLKVNPLNAELNPI